MSLFAESSWEANAVGDKLSKEIFHKKNKGGRNINRSGSANASLKKNHIVPNNIQQESLNKKLTTNHAKRRAKKRQKALLDAAASTDILPKKWVRKSKPQEVVAKTNPMTRQENLEEPKLSTEGGMEQETKSQRRRKKQKLNKFAVKPNASSEEKNSPETSGEKSSGMKNLNLKRLETMLKVKEETRNVKDTVEPESLRERMMSQLRASRFRFLNETLYNNESSESKKYFKEDPDAFAAYHAGYKQQVEQWPLNPLDVVISSIRKMFVE